MVLPKAAVARDHYGNNTNANLGGTLPKIFKLRYVIVEKPYDG